MSTTPSIPDLSPDDTSLFELYAQLTFDLHALSEQTGRGLVELLDWALSPPIQALMDALEFLAERVVRLAALKARPVAIDTLRRLALTAEDHKERRLAAAVLERASKVTRAACVRIVSQDGAAAKDPLAPDETQAERSTSLQAAGAPDLEHSTADPTGPDTAATRQTRPGPSNAAPPECHDHAEIKPAAHAPPASRAA